MVSGVVVVGLVLMVGSVVSSRLGVVGSGAGAAAVVGGALVEAGGLVVSGLVVVGSGVVVVSESVVVVGALVVEALVVGDGAVVDGSLGSLGLVLPARVCGMEELVEASVVGDSCEEEEEGPLVVLVVGFLVVLGLYRQL